MRHYSTYRLVKKYFFICAMFTISQTLYSQPGQLGFSHHYYNIIDSVSADRLEQDITTLAGFGTRNTLSDTTSSTRGIGAARRWIRQEFEKISDQCGGCLDVFEVSKIISAEGNSRIPADTRVVNIVAVQKGSTDPGRYIIMSGDIDSRNSNATDGKGDAPGANDNATGMAGTLEAARVLTKYDFSGSIVYLGLSGEEQGLFGGQIMAEYARANGWDIIGVLNNDMIGNIEGVDGVIDNRTFRIFSEPTPATEPEQDRLRRRYYGGEVDGVSRQLARYIHRMTTTYMPEMNPMMIYRLDRFGRGGHHKPFNDAGYPGVRIMEAHENYIRQHQDLRTENGVEYGDVLDGVNFDYTRKLTAVNAITLAGLAWAPPAPDTLRIGGVVEPSAQLEWSSVKDKDLLGYKIYWRRTTAPQWQYSRFVGNVNQFTLEGIIIDNYFFGVAAVDHEGNESVVRFPNEVMR